MIPIKFIQFAVIKDLAMETDIIIDFLVLC